MRWTPADSMRKDVPIAGDRSAAATATAAAAVDEEVAIVISIMGIPIREGEKLDQRIKGWLGNRGPEEKEKRKEKIMGTGS